MHFDYILRALLAQEELLYLKYQTFKMKWTCTLTDMALWGTPRTRALFPHRSRGQISAV